MDWSRMGPWARDPISLLASVLQAASSVFGWLILCAKHCNYCFIGTKFGAHCINGDYSSRCPCSKARTRSVATATALAVGQE